MLFNESFVPDKEQAKAIMEQFLAVNGIQKENLTTYLTESLTNLYVAVLEEENEKIKGWLITVENYIRSLINDQESSPTLEQKSELEKLLTAIKRDFEY